MKIFSCQNCQHLLYFENSLCISCQHTVGYDAIQGSMLTLEKVESAPAAGATAVTNATTVADPATGVVPEKKASPIYSDISSKILYKFCQNSEFGTCNWLIPIDQPATFCQACQLNRIIPPLTDDQMLGKWKRIEVAKHRMVYSLLRLQLPVAPKGGKEESGIAFDFMADLPGGERIMTGHDNGVITLNIEEADEQERVRNKLDLGERYRTLLGHFRHEIGHYYWDLLISDNPSIEGFRLLFGDERKDYGESLQSYYQTGAPADWTNNFISPYASAHPWEDWAETWAHYMHLMDTLETAYSFGIGIHPGKTDELDTDIHKDPYLIKDFHRIIDLWLPLTFAVNSLNRSMGHADFYPFVISPVVIQKLRFIHERINTRTGPAKRVEAAPASTPKKEEESPEAARIN